MPLSTALPAPTIEFFGDFSYPNVIVNCQVATAAAVDNSTSRTRPGTGQAPETVAPVITSGGGGVVGPDWRVLGGRPCARITSAGTTASSAWAPDVWQPSFTPTPWNPGALLEPDCVVGIFDFHVACTSAVFVAGTADQTGFWFQPLIPVMGSFVVGTPGGGGPVGGFGIALNDDGAGANRWEFVSYNVGGAILQRTVIGAAIVPSVTLWSSFRFTIVSAAAGRPATLSLQVNRASVPGVQAIPFDDVVLMRPNTLAPTASRWTPGHALGAMGGAGYFFSVFFRFGRFTASGEEIQGL